MKKWLISLLALTCAFGFVGCGGAVEDSSSQGGSTNQSSSEASSSLNESAPEEENSSVEEVAPEIGDSSEEGENIDSTQQEQPITEEQKAALQAVFGNFNNCTINEELNYVLGVTENDQIKGLINCKARLSLSIDGNKRRAEEEAWVTDETGELRYTDKEVDCTQTIDERTEYSWYYDVEEEVWYKNEHTMDDEEYEEFLAEQAEEKRVFSVILDSLYYNSETKLYVAKDLVLYQSEEDETRLDKLLEISIEMKDGKLVQIIGQFVSFNGDLLQVLGVREGQVIYNVTLTFTEWGTTVVNLPEVYEE